MKIFTLLIILLSLFSCSSNEERKDVFGKTIENKSVENSFAKRAKREIETKLEIPVTEKYEIKIHFAYLNADEKKDAIITINRLEFAMDEAAKAPNTVKRAELGYMGNYNFFFFYDGKIDKISVPMTVASSAKTPLKVKFNNIQSEIYQDVSIDYRIKNSSFRNYYMYENASLNLVFQWKLFDQIGLESYEANYIEYQSGTLSLAKDILIYKGKIKNYPKNIENVYKYNPVIEKTDLELYRFFYDPRTMKYMTKIK
ncbi:MAG: hypothetical protein V4622_00765 [Bacteroidota bacterium]